MTGKPRMLIIAFVLGPMLGLGMAANQRQEEDYLRLLRAPLDYALADNSVRAYDLTYGVKRDVAVCSLTVVIEKGEQGPSGAESAHNTRQLTLTYSGFAFRLDNKAEEVKFAAILRDSKIKTFEYTAELDTRGNLISSNLRARLEPLLNSSHDPTRQLARKILKPMVEFTWLYLFPRLGPDKRGHLRGRDDAEDWEVFAWPEFQEDLAELELGVFLNVARQPQDVGLNILWADLTYQTGSTKYGAGQNVKEVKKIEIYHDKEIKSTRKASVHWTPIINDEEQTTTFFVGTLRAE